MKKFKFVLLMLILVIGLNTKAESTYTYGEAIDFQSGVVGRYWHPFMKIAQYDSNDADNLHLDLFIVILKTTDTYHSFPDESKLLLKFSDDSVVELNSFGDIIKDYQCTIIANHLQDVYYTGRNYVLTDDALQKILSLPIVKVRIELANGNRKDYEIGEKHGKKVLKKLQKSYNSVSATQNQRQQNVSGDLKDDF